ncbi:unnamed protein product [Nezara viridula]|uniref:Uncharacterized protein n=1 Tax=Nezara viridula TaxID=85310 RepID=A0A9P0E6F1_NEZVI|nr:unnamed protein product [Nezara viridula]
MKLYHLNLLFVVLTNGLLSVSGARLKCPSVSIANGSFKIRSKGRIIVYKCSRGFYLLGEAYAACIKGKWDSNPPVCMKPGCPRPTNLLNGKVQDSWRSSLLKFTCNPGFKLIGPPYIYCNGRQWNAPQPICQAVDIKCDFEKKNTCNWIIDDYDDDDFNWRLQQHETPSRVLKTGPLHDHTLSPNTTGQYLVLDTSEYMPSSKPARIHSPVFPQPPDNSSCFIFWYHMYGNTIGTLNVFLNNVLSFQRQGNHGDRWIKGIISLSENVTRSDLQVIIEGTYGGGYTGDIGLDDFSIGNGTDCLGSAVKSCVGRCYEDKNEVSSCLCNPECSVDASCCEDFLDVCSIESTTPFFEASTGVEDSTQVYSDTSGTTDYETSYSEPISSTELGFTAASENSTDTSSFTSLQDLDSIYSKADVEQFEKTEFLNSSGKNHDVTGTEFHSLSTSSYAQKEHGTTNSTKETIIVNRFAFSTGIMAQTTDRTTVSTPENNITVKSFYNTTTEATSKHYDYLFKLNSLGTTSTKADLSKFTKFITNSIKTTIIPQAISTKTFFFKVPTDKTFNPNNLTENTTTLMPLKILRTKEPDINNKTDNKGSTTNMPLKIITLKIKEPNINNITERKSSTTYLPLKINLLTTKEPNKNNKTENRRSTTYMPFKINLLTTKEPNINNKTENRGSTTYMPLKINLLTTKEPNINNKTENKSSTTFITVKMNTLKSKQPNTNKNFTTNKTVFLTSKHTQSTTPFHSTKVYQTTPVPNLTSSRTSKSVTKSLNPLGNGTTLHSMAPSNKITPVQSSTNAILKNLKSITPSLEKNKFYFNITSTIVPLFHNVTVPTTSVQTKMATSKVDSKKIVNDSHTHLQTTSQSPPLLNTTEGSVPFTFIITNTQPIKLNTVNRSKKWKSIYKPKGEFYNMIGFCLSCYRNFA